MCVYHPHLVRILCTCIFQMTIEGKGPYQIGKILTDEKITRPSVYIVVPEKALKSNCSNIL